VLVGCLLIMAGAGCTPRVVLESERAIEVLDPVRIASHHLRLNAVEATGRRTATVGYATAAAYVAERLAGLGIQPIHPGEYRQVSFGPINHIAGAVVTLLGADSTRWGADASMLPDPRSASARVEVSVFRLLGSGMVPQAEPGGTTMAVVHATPSDSLVYEIARRGYAALLVVGVPKPGRSKVRLPIAVLQMGPQRWERIAGASSTDAEGPLSLRIRIEASYDPVAPYISVLGILPGSHPVGRRRAVVLGATLDSASNPSGTSLVDPGGSGIGAAALLEVARLLAAEADRGEGVGHSIIFAWFAGGAQENAVLNGFLRSPPWAVSAIDEVAFVGPALGVPVGDPAADILLTRLGADTVLSTPSPTPVRDQGQALAIQFLAAGKRQR
jgi:hypothetical protein